MQNLSQSKRGDGLKILMVEDDSVIVNVYETKLRGLGFGFLSLQSAEGNFIKSVVDFKPDLVLLDLILCPSQEKCLDGFDAYQMLKAREETKNIPVIFLTNQFDEDDIARAKSLGADSYIIKASMTPSQVADRILATIRTKKFS